MAKIKTIEIADGSKRYRFTADVGRHPDGKRRQQRFTFTRLKDAQAELSRIGYQRPRGEYVPKWNGTLDELCDSYLRAATRGKEANTQVCYRDALRIPRERLGRRRAQTITRDDIEALVDWALEHGRVRGGAPGSGLGVRSARLMLGRLSAAFEQAIDDQKVARNPCRKVRITGGPKPKRVTWSEAEVLRFLEAAAADRLYGAWWLTVLGLRRGEICGLRWEDVDFDKRTITVERARVLVDGAVIEKSTKTERGERTLPVPRIGAEDRIMAALEALQARQMEEMAAAAAAYVNSGFVAADEIGAPLNPERYSDEFGRVAGLAAVPRVRLHDSRHAISSILARAGVPAHIRGAWIGNSAQVNEQVYTHSSAADLETVGDVISKALSTTV